MSTSPASARSSAPEDVSGPARQSQQSFFRLARSPLKFKLFLLTQLPSAFFAGIRIKDVDSVRGTAAIPYKWFTKNPFRSTYFACLSMAAEMSTGLLAMAHTYGRKPSISMLVVNMEASFFKKATGRTQFQCTDGALIAAAVEQAVATGEATTVKARSIGTSKDGEIIAEFLITWSFKMKKS